MVCANPACQKEFVQNPHRSSKKPPQRWCSRECCNTHRCKGQRGRFKPVCREAFLANCRKRVEDRFRAILGPLSARDVEVLKAARMIWYRQGYEKGYRRAAWLRGRAA